MTKTIAIGIPSGQATRDVIHSGVLANLLAQPEVKVVILTPANLDLKELVQNYGDRVIIEHLGDYHSSFAERFIRSIYSSSLYYDCDSIRHKVNLGKLAQLVPVVWLLQRCLGRHRLWAVLNWINRHLGSSSECREALRAQKPDLAVLTRVFNFSADYQLLKEAARQEIPTLAVVSSWDNFTTKGFFPFEVDEIIVWNEIMRQEAIDLFDFPSDKIHIAGVPRFDHYFSRSSLRDCESFFQKCRLSSNKKTITYTTANRGLLNDPEAGVSPEVEIIRHLASQIEAGAFTVPTQLLVRLHPLAELDDYRAIVESEHVRFYQPGRTTTFRDRLLDMEEERVLAETMCYSDVVINIASTITIDAAIFDTPIICIAFDWLGKQPAAFSVGMFYKRDHYRKIAATHGYQAVYSCDELTNAINAYLNDPSLHREGRTAIVRQQCQFSDGKSAARVAQILLEKIGYPDGSPELPLRVRPSATLS
jgi:hypothetical protein